MLRLDAVNYDTATVTRVAARHGVLNLASGICKLPAPDFLIAAAVRGLGCASFVEDYDGPAGHVVGRIAVLAALQAEGHGDDDANGAGLEDLELDSVLVTPGVSYGLALVARHLRRSYRTVLIPSPTYSSAGQTFLHAGFRVEAVYARQGGGGHLGLPSVRDVIRAVDAAGPCVLYLNEFNNPTGQRHTPAELLELAGAVERAGGRMVIDAITADIRRDAPPGEEPEGAGNPAEGARQFSFAELVRCVHQRSVFVLGGLSKDRPVPGLRVGWLIAPVDEARSIADHNLCEQPGSVGISSAVLFRDRLARSTRAGCGAAFRERVSALLDVHCGSDAPLLAYLESELDEAANFARRDGEWARTMAGALAANLEHLRSRLPALGLELVIDPDGGYNLLVQSRGAEARDSVGLCHEIFRGHGLQLMPGESLGCHPGTAARRFTTRLSLCMREDAWRTGLLRLERALDDLGIGRG